MRRVHVLIYGDVHGVFFRHNTKLLADKLKVKGFVRNVSEGVEAVFEGSDSTIDELLIFCRKGPPGAVVDKVDVKEEKYKGEFDSFEIRY
ncbi:MAG: acylphosphatase [Candidatus Nanoarchaeia archaeon]